MRAFVSDPDDDKLTTNWWQYREAGTYRGVVDIARPSDRRTSFAVPSNARPCQTIHMILKVTDPGREADDSLRTNRRHCPLTRYGSVDRTSPY
ncbi:hypothetical protein [Paractinoplanes maris]|uniref:hypothetical protein n=1 Tax=Paractinoplanes maris TaxID=1734446 RepID=UPI0034DACBA0